MKRILLQIVLALCIVPMQAQKTSSKKYMDNDDIHYGMVKWGERKLRWDDFRGAKPMSDRTSSVVKLYAQPKFQKIKKDDIWYKYNVWECFFVQEQSWIDTKNMNESKLKLCQNKFDMWEILAREVAVEYPRMQFESLEAQYTDMRKKFDEESEWMERATNHGNNAQVVDSIADELAKELADKEFDPRDIVKGYEPSIVSWMLDVGLVVNVPFTEYTSPAVGFSGGMSYNRKGFLYGLDIDMAFASKCKKQILAKKGHVEDGDRLIHGGITFYFGYNAYNRNKKSYTPFIGAGVRFINGGEKYEEYWPKNVKNDMDKRYELAGFSVGVGVMADFKVKHTVNMSYKLFSMESTETHVRVKPYFSLTNYPKPLGWTPALNLCVGVNGKSYRMKKSKN